MATSEKPVSGGIAAPLATLMEILEDIAMAGDNNVIRPAWLTPAFLQTLAEVAGTKDSTRFHGLIVQDYPSCVFDDEQVQGFEGHCTIVTEDGVFARSLQAGKWVAQGHHAWSKAGAADRFEVWEVKDAQGQGTVYFGNRGAGSYVAGGRFPVGESDGSEYGERIAVANHALTRIYAGGG